MLDIRGGHDGTAIDGVQFSSGYIGNAFVFDGTSAVRVPYASSLAPTSGLTIEGWVRLGVAQTPYARVAGRQIDYSASSTWVFGMATGVYFGLYKNSMQTYINGTTPLPVGTWTHIAGTWDGLVMRIYLGGAVQQDVAAVTSPLTATTLPVFIGRGDGPTLGFRGQIDELTLYDRALTADEVSAIAANQLGKCK